jgi:hypothetical protein
MDAVRRTASLEIAAFDTASDSVLRNLIQEVSTLRESIQRPEKPKGKKTKKLAPHLSQIFHVIGSPQKRTAITEQLELLGIPKDDFKRFLTYSVPPDLLPSARTWDVQSWADYLAKQIKEAPVKQKPATTPSTDNAPTPKEQLDVSVKSVEAPNTAPEPTAAAPSVSDEPSNPKVGEESTSASGGCGSALDR